MNKAIVWIVVVLAVLAIAAFIISKADNETEESSGGIVVRDVEDSSREDSTGSATPALETSEDVFSEIDSTLDELG